MAALSVLFSWQNIQPSGIEHLSLFFYRMYPLGGFTNFLQSNSSPENFHLVGNTTSTTRISPTTPSFRGTLPGESNAQDKETINVDEDKSVEDGRTER
jgi:hypothetical protein